MSNFKQNTVETVGDAALTASIIDRSITKIHDDISANIGIGAFRTCISLIDVNFPNATDVAESAFNGCSALAMADFAACVALGRESFKNCSSLAALILRSDTVVTLGTDAFVSSGISGGTGYIYVPSALVDTYKETTGWSTYADQIRAIEDYPFVCSKWTWDGVFAAIDAGTYATDYAIGDTIPLDLGTEGLVNMQIAAFDADDLADGSGKAPISWISKEVLYTAGRMNPALVTNDDGTYQEGTGTIGGWEKCEMRTYLNDTIKPLIPEDVRNNIVSVSKSQDAYDTAGVKFTQTTQDDVWIPGYNECFGNGIYTGLFNSSALRVKKRITIGSLLWWWMSSLNDTASFKCITSGGNSSSDSVSSKNGIVLGFCTK